MALVKGVEKVVEAEGFDLSFLKEKIKELNDAGILENKVKVVAVSKPVMVDSFLKAIESIPEGSAEEKAIPKDVTILYNAYVDVLEDKSLAIPVVVKEGEPGDREDKQGEKLIIKEKVKTQGRRTTKGSNVEMIINALKEGISFDNLFKKASDFAQSKGQKEFTKEVDVRRCIINLKKRPGYTISEENGELRLVVED